MAWSHRTRKFSNGGASTAHTAGAIANSLYVEHSKNPDGSTYSQRVTLHRPSSMGREYSTVHWYPEDGSGFVVHGDSKYQSTRQESVAIPSERVQQLIAQHHLHPDQWPILLDALQEEYPQLHEAIESHHAARRAAAESDATQYARALEATLTDLRSDTPLKVTRFAADGTRTVTTERLSEIAAKR